MRRADRLFRLVQLLRKRRFATAEELAEALAVSKRTVYRDIRDLQDSDVPIHGEAGVGYTLQRGFELPPLTFSTAELESLVLGARMVQAWADPALGEAAATAIEKIEGVLPDALRRVVDESALFAMRLHREADVEGNLGLLRTAVRERRVVRFEYEAQDGRRSDRQVRSLGLFFWGQVWTLASWDPLRADFRSFRTDRMSALALTDTRFAPDERDLDAFLQAQRRR